MSLIYELDLNILKMYLRCKNQLSRLRLSNVKALQTDGQTDTQVGATDAMCTLHLQVVKTLAFCVF